MSSHHLNPFPAQDATHEHLAQGLSQIVSHSETTDDVSLTIHSSVHKIASLPLLHKFIPGIEKWETSHHFGNYVAIRGTNETIFESMPIYARIGMHLVFYGKEEIKVLHNKTVEEHLKDQSIKEGEIYDSPKSVASIASFIHTYNIQTSELLNPNITTYKTFNEFFYRKLKPGARPVQNASDPKGFCSAADCRLTVFDTIKKASDLWIKGNNFSLRNLLGSDDLASQFEEGSLAVFRLAPADYHRFHSPTDVTVGELVNYPGQYYTVNPQAVNEPGFDVFTANKRSVLMLRHSASGLPIAFVAIGALLVGSITFTAEEGQQVKRGDELGYFAYGGSTVVVLFSEGLIKFDHDIETNSEKKLETLVKELEFEFIPESAMLLYLNIYREHKFLQIADNGVHDKLGFVSHLIHKSAEMLVISNPTCGDRLGHRFIERHVLPLLSEHQYRLATTTGVGDAGRIALEYVLSSNNPIIIVGGGDGTLHEVVNGLFDASKTSGSTRLGLPRLQVVLLPLGTANALYSSLFPPEQYSTLGDVEYKLLSLQAFLHHKPGYSKSLSIQSTSLIDAEGNTQSSIFSVVVTSTSLHASILYSAEKLRGREDLPGVERFKVAAQDNISNWYYAHVKLLGGSSGHISQYDPTTKLFRELAPDASSLEGPFQYFLSTVNVDRLEPAFRITPLQSSLPAPLDDQNHMDIVVVRPRHHPLGLLSSGKDEDAAKQAFVSTSVAVLTQAYKEGAHVDLRYHEDGTLSPDALGSPTVEYYRCGGWEWIPTSSHPLSRLICADGTILNIPEDGGMAKCRLISLEKVGGGITVYTLDP